LATLEQLSGGFGDERNKVNVCVANHRAKKRRQNLFTRLRYARNTLRDARMPGQNLMAAFVSDHRFEREIFRVRIALKCLCVNSQEIGALGASSTVLGAARLAIYMTILDFAHETKLSRDTLDSVLPCN
jgi:hypothetical protein